MKNKIKEIDNSDLMEILETTAKKEFYRLTLDNELVVRLYNWIINLQEELEVSKTNEETYRLEMLDITKILGLDEHTIFDEVKEKATNLQEENERLKEIEKEHKNCTRKHWQQKCAEHCANEMLYKSKIDKAIEKIIKIQENAIKYGAYHDASICQDLLNILNGGDE